MTRDAVNPLDLVGGDQYEHRGYPHEAWTVLRREDPVHRFESETFPPFWAIVKYGDVAWVSRQPRRFLNAPRLVMSPRRFPLPPPEESVRSLLNMDPPDHVRYRALVNRHFTPHALRGLRAHVEEICGEIVGDVVERAGGPGAAGTCDFVADVAARLPLAVIMELLGVPRHDWEQIFHWSNEAIAPGDAEYRRGGTSSETAERAQRAFFDYFAGYVAERRRHPRADLVSILSAAEIDGRSVADHEILSYCFLLAVAGNETTRNATSGGLLALIENPAELARLRDDPSLIPTAVEEVLRWTSPVVHFCRTAVEDVEIRGRTVRAGDLLVLFYPSANRDEEVFEEPFRFDVGRTPNDHYAFGIGEHFCLGANLARTELEVMLGECLRRFADVELAGPIERQRSSLVGGIKRMPVRFRAAA